MFPNVARDAVEVKVDDLNGEKTVEFNFNGLDYSFVFNPNTDAPKEGATLTYCGNKTGRISPKENAQKGVWAIANEMMGVG